LDGELLGSPRVLAMIKCVHYNYNMQDTFPVHKQCGTIHFRALTRQSTI